MYKHRYGASGDGSDELSDVDDEIDDKYREEDDDGDLVSTE